MNELMTPLITKAERPETHFADLITEKMKKEIIDFQNISSESLQREFGKTGRNNPLNITNYEGTEEIICEKLKNIDDFRTLLNYKDILLTLYDRGKKEEVKKMIKELYEITLKSALNSGKDFFVNHFFTYDHNDKPYLLSIFYELGYKEEIINFIKENIDSFFEKSTQQNSKWLQHNFFAINRNEISTIRQLGMHSLVLEITELKLKGQTGFLCTNETVENFSFLLNHNRPTDEIDRAVTCLKSLEYPFKLNSVIAKDIFQQLLKHKRYEDVIWLLKNKVEKETFFTSYSRYTNNELNEMISLLSKAGYKNDIKELFTDFHDLNNKSIHELFVLFKIGFITEKIKEFIKTKILPSYTQKILSNKENLPYKDLIHLADMGFIDEIKIIVENTILPEIKKDIEEDNLSVFSAFDDVLTDFLYIKLGYHDEIKNLSRSSYDMIDINDTSKYNLMKITTLFSFGYFNDFLKRFPTLEKFCHTLLKINEWKPQENLYEKLTYEEITNLENLLKSNLEKSPPEIDLLNTCYTNYARRLRYECLVATKTSSEDIKKYFNEFLEKLSIPECQFILMILKKYNGLCNKNVLKLIRGYENGEQFMVEIDKTDSELFVTVFDDSSSTGSTEYKGRGIVFLHRIKEQAFNAWRHACESGIPVAPIIDDTWTYDEKDNNVLVPSRYCGLSVQNIIDMYTNLDESHQPSRVLFLTLLRIQCTLLTQQIKDAGIDHGHPHKANMTVEFINKEYLNEWQSNGGNINTIPYNNEKITFDIRDYANDPKQWELVVRLIDFDRATSDL